MPVACWVALPAGPAAAEDVGWLRVAHLSPDTPAADVTVAPAGSTTAATTEPGLGYGSVSPWHPLAPGSYTVAVRAAGAGASTGPVLSTRVDVGPGAARTVALVGRFADLRLAIQDEDLSPPDAGRARVRVVDAAAPGPVDVSLAGGQRLASGLRLATSGQPTEVPGGPATLATAAAGAPPVDVQVDLAAGSVTTLLVLEGADGGLTVRPVVDAGGPSTVPIGPVQAGGGGTAGGSPFRLLAAAVAEIADALKTDAAEHVPSRATAGGPDAAATPATPAPLRVQLPGVDAPVLPIGLDASGALVPPDDVATTGWFSGGPAPGDVGPAVIAGHVDSVDRPGAFFRLGALSPGDPITVTRADGSTLRFVVTQVARYPKTAFPTAEVYGATPDAELRLVTCGGAFDRGARSYEDDVVVFARAT